MTISLRCYDCSFSFSATDLCMPSLSIQDLLTDYVTENGLVFVTATCGRVTPADPQDCIVVFGQRRGQIVQNSSHIITAIDSSLTGPVTIALVERPESGFSIRHPAWNTAYNKGQDTRKRFGICSPDASWTEGGVSLLTNPPPPDHTGTAYVLEMIAVPKKKDEVPFNVNLTLCSEGNYEDSHYIICDEKHGKRTVNNWYLVDMYQRNYMKRLKDSHKIVCVSVYREGSLVPNEFVAVHIVNREKWPQALQRSLSVSPWCSLKGSSHVARESAVDTDDSLLAEAVDITVSSRKRPRTAVFGAEEKPARKRRRSARSVAGEVEGGLLEVATSLKMSQSLPQTEMLPSSPLHEPAVSSPDMFLSSSMVYYNRLLDNFQAVSDTGKGDNPFDSASPDSRANSSPLNSPELYNSISSPASPGEDMLLASASISTLLTAQPVTEFPCFTSPASSFVPLNCAPTFGAPASILDDMWGDFTGHQPVSYCL